MLRWGLYIIVGHNKKNMRNILLILILLKPMVALSQDTILLTGNDSILMIQLAKNFQKMDSLQKLIVSLDKSSDSIYLSLTKPIVSTSSDFNYQDILHAKRKFDDQYQDIIISSNFPNDLPIDSIQNHLIIGFGQKIHPIYKIQKFHNGIDIQAEKGTPVKATLSGQVEIAKESQSGHGKHVILKSNDNVKVIFAHLDSIYVKTGEYVNKGDIIGKVGNTGLSIKNHLHYEILINNEPVNPIFATFNRFSEADLRLIFTQNGMTFD